MEKILIVDDDAELRETVSILLERERFIPIQAVDGQSGLEKAFSMKPNLLIVDLRLPGLSGIEASSFAPIELRRPSSCSVLRRTK
jgi:DNA-binding response OmpR family regulator